LEIEMSPAACDHSPELYERVAVLEQLVEEMAPKVKDMHEMMLQTRGASRLGRAVAGAAAALGIGGVMGHKWAAFLTWLGS